ncbi:uncharacterized protein LOC127879117 [Dreissena polymorpha]|nr:uncharacterized protein LOC127879117 [Dreissena polymorpha]
MRFVFPVLVLGAVVIASDELTRTTDGEWAYELYDGQKFTIDCRSALNISALTSPTIVWKRYANDQMVDIQSSDAAFTMIDFTLLINEIKPELYGVYMCEVRNSGDDSKDKGVFGINLHRARYHTLGEKYRRNLIVAVVAAVVFLVPLVGSCLVHYFRWETRHMKSEKSRYYGGYKMSKNGLGSSVQSPDGIGAYDNPVGDDTKL